MVAAEAVVGNAKTATIEAAANNFLRVICPPTWLVALHALDTVPCRGRRKDIPTRRGDESPRRSGLALVARASGRGRLRDRVQHGLPLDLALADQEQGENGSGEGQQAADEEDLVHPGEEALTGGVNRAGRQR